MSDCDCIVDIRAGLKMGRELEPREIVGSVRAAMEPYGVPVVDLTADLSTRGPTVLDALEGKKTDSTVYVIPNCKSIRKIWARACLSAKPGSIRFAFEERDGERMRPMVVICRGKIIGKRGPIFTLDEQIAYVKTLFGDEDTCCICCDKLSKRPGFQLPCKHHIHTKCFFKWGKTQWSNFGCRRSVRATVQVG